MKIVVCPLSQVETVVRMRKPSHLITLLDPDHRLETPSGVVPERHLKVGVHDINEKVEGLVAPNEAVVDEIISFGRDWDASLPILVHCWAGISRSTATAFILACDKNPGASEAEIAREIRRRSRYAWPNRRIVALADWRLGRGGRMVDAVEAMGAREVAYEGEPFEFNARW